MAYGIQLAPSAAKAFEKLERRIQTRIQSKIDALANNPPPNGVEKLAGADSLYRVRVGGFRVIYDIQDKVLLVLVLRIGDRKDVYR